MKPLKTDYIVSVIDYALDLINLALSTESSGNQPSAFPPQKNLKNKESLEKEREMLRKHIDHAKP